MPENITLKNYLKDVLGYLGTTISKKRRELKSIIKVIFNVLADNKFILESEFHTHKIEYKNKICLNYLESDCDKNGIICTSDDKEIFDKQYDIEDIVPDIHHFSNNEKLALKNNSNLI